MNNHFPSLSALRAFEAAGRLGSFKLAAEELSVTATAISHRIRILEETLKSRLFVRKTRAVELTEQGKVLHAAVHEGFNSIAAGVRKVEKLDRESVTLSTTPAFAAKWLIPRMPDFRRLHPDIDLHVHASCEPMDLRGGVADLAIRYGQGLYPRLQTDLLVEDTFIPVASPRLRVRKARDIRRYPLLHFDFERPLPVDLSWTAWMRMAEFEADDTQRHIRYSEESHCIQAAIAGEGIALLSALLVEEELKLGLLESRVEPRLRGLSYYLVRPVSTGCSAAVDTVGQWLLGAFKNH